MLPKITQHGFHGSSCVHVVLKPKPLRPSKIKEVDSGASETIVMKNSFLAYLLGNTFFSYKKTFILLEPQPFGANALSDLSLITRGIDTIIYLTIGLHVPLHMRPSVSRLVNV